MALETARIPVIRDQFPTSTLDDNDIFLVYKPSTGQTHAILASEFLNGSDVSNFRYSSTKDYALDEPTIEGDKWYISLQTPNVGNLPSSSPLFWQQVNKIAVNTLKRWASGLYVDNEVFVVDPLTLGIYELNPSTPRPFNSNDNPSIDTSNWSSIGAGVNAVNVQQNTYTYDEDTGAADAYDITLSPAIVSYVEGQSFKFKAANANTGASTIDVNGLGVKSIVRRDGTALQSGDIPTGSINEVLYDGSNFQLLNSVSSGGAGGTLKTGTVITFEGNNIYNSSTPLTGNITFDFTNAKIGAEVIVRHNDSVAPTLPAQVNYLGGNYRLSEDNYIKFTYVSNSIVYYSFSQSTLALLDNIEGSSPNQVLFVDSTGRLNGSANFKFDTSFNFGNSSAASVYFKIKSQAGFGTVFSTQNNGNGFLFRITSDGRIYLGNVLNISYYPSSNGTTLDNSGRGMAWDSSLGSSNMPSYTFNASSVVPAGSGNRYPLFRKIATITANAGSGGNEITGNLPLNYNQVVINSNSFFTGRVVYNDYLTSVTGALDTKPIFRIRDGVLGVGIGTDNPTAWGDFAASTIDEASLRLRTGVAPTSPNDGDIWQDGTDLLVRINGVSYTLDKTAV